MESWKERSSWKAQKDIRKQKLSERNIATKVHTGTPHERSEV